MIVHGLSTDKGVVGSRGQISWLLAECCFSIMCQDEGLGSFWLRYAVGLTKVLARGEIIIQVTRRGLETQRTGNHLGSEQSTSSKPETQERVTHSAARLATRARTTV